MNSQEQPPVRETGPYYVRSVGKAIGILEAFRDGPAEMSLAEATRRSGLNRITTYRLLATLERHRLIQRTAAGGYRLGLGLIALGGVVQRESALAEHAAPHLRRLARGLDMTSFLSVLDRDEALCLVRIDAGGMSIVRFRLGERLPLYAGAGPLILLAGLPDAEVEHILQGPLEPLTERTVCEPDAIRARVAQIREEGLAFSDEDVTIGVGAIGAAIRDSRGETVAAVSVSALVQVLYGQRRKEIVEEVRVTARLIGDELG